MIREEAIERLEDTFEAWERWECPQHSPAGLLNEALGMAISALKEQPVVHSKWKYYRKQGKAVCMSCSFERSVDDNFGRAVACPNCGAKMDLEEV